MSKTKEVNQLKPVTMKESELDTIFDNVTHIIAEELKAFDLSPTHTELLGRDAGVKGDNGLYG